MKVNGKPCHLWRAVDDEGEVLEAVVTARRDKAAALKLLKPWLASNTNVIGIDGRIGFGNVTSQHGTAARGDASKPAENPRARPRPEQTCLPQEDHLARAPRDLSAP